MTKRTVTIAAVLSTAAATVLGVVMAETLKIERASVPLRAAAGRAQPLVIEVKRGDTVEIVGRDGKWLKLKSGENVGWTHEADLKPRSKGFANAASIVKDATASGVEETAAGKGVGEGAAVYARSKGMSAEPLDNLVARRKQIIDKGEWVKFAEEGKVGVRD